MLATLVTASHFIICIFLIIIVLLQQGKGADIGATFGGGGNTLFGASGADNLLTKVTTALAILFMCTSVFLAAHGKNAFQSEGGLIDSLPSSIAVENTEAPNEISPQAEATATTHDTSSTAPVVDTSSTEVEEQN